MKSILISRSPERALKILNGEATLDLCKSIPKNIDKIIEEQGGIWVYMYVTKKLPLLAYEIVDYDDSWGNPATDGGYSIQNHIDDFDQIQGDVLNGKVVARWWFDKYEKINLDEEQPELFCMIEMEKYVKEMCLTQEQICDYIPYGKTAYAWHISKLEIFDKPMELSNFKNKDVSKYQDEEGNPQFDDYFELTKAPQSWQYVWVKEK